MIKDMDYVFDLYRRHPPLGGDLRVQGTGEGYDLWAINWKTPYIGNDASNLTGTPGWRRSMPRIHGSP